MISDIHFPEHITAEELDHYLERGWYRMGQVIFTTNFIVYEEMLHRVFWLRYPVASIPFSKSHRHIIALNAKLKVSIKPFELINEYESLYERYKDRVAFEAPLSVEHFLFDGGTGNVYNSFVAEARDGDKLVAVGVFDKGINAIAGIMNFYDPDYAHQSPGKFLMLEKINYAKSRGIEWYYPGYIAEGNPRFDYKLFIGKQYAQIYLPEYNNWVAYLDNWPVPGDVE